MNLDETLAVKDESRDLLARLDDLERRNGVLARAMDRALAVAAVGATDPDALALIALRASLAEERIALLARWVELLTRRLARSERGWREAAGKVAGHEDALRLVAVAIKELNDPYGFGESLDERIGADDEGAAWGRERGRRDDE